MENDFHIIIVDFSIQQPPWRGWLQKSFVYSYAKNERVIVFSESTSAFRENQAYTYIIDGVPDAEFYWFGNQINVTICFFVSCLYLWINIHLNWIFALQILLTMKNLKTYPTYVSFNKTCFSCFFIVLQQEFFSLRISLISSDCSVISYCSSSFWF